MDDIQNLLFTYKGRISRGMLWFAMLIWVIAGVAANVVLLVVGWLLPLFLFVVLLILFLIFLLTSQAFVCIKRLHDHGKSGWWLLLYVTSSNVLPLIGQQVGLVGPIFLIAGFAIGIWMLVELIFLTGTVEIGRAHV